MHTRSKRHHSERGSSLVEYLLLVSLIAIAVIAAVIFLGGDTSSKFQDSGERISQTP